jgi:dolichol-phosphate mannosyltransferase
MDEHFRDLAIRLTGPVLVLGAGGFVGANLLRHLLEAREDVYGTVRRLPAWRLEGVKPERLVETDLLNSVEVDSLLDRVQPRTVFNCVSYGAYSFETDSDLMYRTNFQLTASLVGKLLARDIAFYAHAGSSAEYGENAAGPAETDPGRPNSDYSVSKLACANLLSYYGRKKGFPCANLRLYSVFGPFEDASRLIPALVINGTEGRFPELVNPGISRDFVYVDDVCEAFVAAAVNLPPERRGESFNVGTGRKVTVADAAKSAGGLFGIKTAPVFGSLPDRAWDLKDWYSNPRAAGSVLGWTARTSFEEGLRKTADWYRGLPDQGKYPSSSKKVRAGTRDSVSVIVACYRDEPAIPVMYERLKAVFARLGMDHEIIFVNDNSPDASERVIAEISRRDSHVIGISHSRNFGSQAAFRSGMELASKASCVLLDGDLQDPPELIAEFVAKWREGYDVVYGRRRKREASLFMRTAYKLFYRVLGYFSYISIPEDAGDCSLIDRRMMNCLINFPERDLFLRGLRAFAGFRQVGVDYVRPARMFGTTTNSLIRNIWWAKKGIFSFSYAPLNLMSFLGTFLLLISLLLGVLQVIARVLFPDIAPRGVTTLLLVVLFFGAVNLFATAMLGEYIGKIFEEVKRRPMFIRRGIIRDGEIREVSGGAQIPRTR